MLLVLVQIFPRFKHYKTHFITIFLLITNITSEPYNLKQRKQNTFDSPLTDTSTRWTLWSM